MNKTIDSTMLTMGMLDAFLSSPNISAGILAAIDAAPAVEPERAAIKCKDCMDTGWQLGVYGRIKCGCKEPAQSAKEPVGYTNEYQLEYLKEGMEGAVYPDTEHDTTIPVYVSPIHIRPTFYVGKNGVCTHWLGKDDIPVFCRNGDEALKVMAILDRGFASSPTVPPAIVERVKALPSYEVFNGQVKVLSRAAVMQILEASND